MFFDHLDLFRNSNFEFVFLFILGLLIGAGSRTRTGTGLAAFGILSLALPFPIGTYHITIPLMSELPASVVVGICHWSGMVRAQDGHNQGAQWWKTLVISKGFRTPLDY